MPEDSMVTINFRCPPEVLRRAEEQARRNLRSRNSELLHLVLRGLDSGTDQDLPRRDRAA